MKTKKCSFCKETKPQSEFYKRNTNTATLASVCKQCSSSYGRKWHIKNKYGLSWDAYIDLYNSQEGKCQICNKFLTIETGSNTVKVDHCHTTGNIRGLLCHQCNSLLGYAFDNTQILENAINYLNQTT